MAGKRFAATVAVLAALAFPVVSCRARPEPPAKPPADPYAAARARMVEEIKGYSSPWIRDRKVLKAMGKVERHLFVGEGEVAEAYENMPLPIGEGQVIAQPYVVALMTQAAALRGGGKVLEVGTGSGYEAAVLAEIASQVYTIDILEPPAKKAEVLLKSLGYQNIHVRVGDGFLGWPEEAPFDAILVTGWVPKFPPPLVEQLKEGGRIVAPVGEETQVLGVGTKKAGKLKRKDLGPVAFVPMMGPGAEASKKRSDQTGDGGTASALPEEAAEETTLDYAKIIAELLLLVFGIPAALFAGHQYKAAKKPDVAVLVEHPRIGTASAGADKPNVITCVVLSKFENLGPSAVCNINCYCRFLTHPWIHGESMGKSSGPLLLRVGESWPQAGKSWQIELNMAVDETERYSLAVVIECQSVASGRRYAVPMFLHRPADRWEHGQVYELGRRWWEVLTFRRPADALALLDRLQRQASLPMGTQIRVVFVKRGDALHYHSYPCPALGTAPEGVSQIYLQDAVREGYLPHRECGAPRWTGPDVGEQKNQADGEPGNDGQN